MEELDYGISWKEWLPLPWRKWRVILRVENADEVPDSLPNRTAVVVGPRSRPKWLVFDCPCRRKHRIMLNLDPSIYPRWSLLHNKKLTIKPSIIVKHRNLECHFFIRNGKIEWINQGSI